MSLGAITDEKFLSEIETAYNTGVHNNFPGHPILKTAEFQAAKKKFAEIRLQVASKNGFKTADALESRIKDLEAQLEAHNELKSIIEHHLISEDSAIEFLVEIGEEMERLFPAAMG